MEEEKGEAVARKGKDSRVKERSVGGGGIMTCTVYEGLFKHS